tara:strand:- start:474729 stop:475100 length:372 start_codon:yes stop_codon:yes gene_type:complete
MKKHALVLFAHGARDARWAAPFQSLQKIVQEQAPDMTVALAFLELMSPRLPELAVELVAAGVEDVTIVPVFFGQGGHVLRDLPLIVETLRAEYPHVNFKTVDAVGEDAKVQQAIATYCLGSMA